jgi:hypothetical protein
MAHRVRRLLEKPKLRPKRIRANMVAEIAKPENHQGQGCTMNSHMVAEA